ncbi:MAG: hypothetical protein COB67_05415 [SAR324 cluster bacterium]|uniref:FDX-ACB domain-containing protein n=1 Tax=SAR324 cluster bacterium TaxID=2024889 RepID=A0A2A4T699_9DELT|nr:MAG: hypothetical protein COB67_05415 [SAR324 cluster bacterium]
MDKKEYKYLAPPKFPSVNFELSIIVPERSLYQDMANLVRKVDRRIIKVDYLSVFFLENQPQMKSLSISMEFQSPEKTLDSQEVKELQDRVIEKLADSGYPLR